MTSNTGDSHNIPRLATRFRFRIATAAAVTRSRIPIVRRVVADKFFSFAFTQSIQFETVSI